MENLDLVFEETGVVVASGKIEILVPAMMMVLFPRGSLITRANGERYLVAKYGEKLRKDGMLFVHLTLEKHP